MSLKIVMPCAGLGKRFAVEGYELPKPLIDAGGKPIMQLAIESLRPKRHDYQFIFIVQKEHCDKYQIDKKLKEIEPNCEIVTIDGVTEGSGISVLAASHLTYNHEIIISVCDSMHIIDIDDFIDCARDAQYDGLMATFETDSGYWCYTELDKKGKFVRCKEKEHISTHANTGVWYFGSGLDYIWSMTQVILHDDRVNNEFYSTMAYNYLGGDIGIYNAGFIPLGIPSELEAYLDKSKTIG